MSQATLTSTPVNIQYLDNIVFQAIFTGSPVGIFSVQSSLTYNQDANGNILNAGTWTALTLNPTPSIAAAGNLLIDMNQLSMPWIRLVYTKTSGTGTLNAYVGGKMV